MNEIKKILHKLIGNDNILSNNILFIDFTGSHEKAQFLSQIFYWSSRTKRADGYFAKRYDEWFTEVRVKGHSVRRYTKEFIKKGFLETKVKKFDGVPTVHYKLDQEKLISALLTFCDSNNLSQSHRVIIECDTESESMNVTQSNNPLTEITTETTTEIKSKTEVSPLIADSVKKQIGPTQYKVLKKIFSKGGANAERLLSLSESKIEAFLEFLEYKKEIGKAYKSPMGINKISKPLAKAKDEEVRAAVDKTIASNWQSLNINPVKNKANTDEALNDTLLPADQNERYQQYVTGIIEHFPNLWKSECRILSKSEWQALNYNDESIFKNIRVSFTRTRAAKVRKEIHELFERNHFERKKYARIYDAIISDYRNYMNREKTLVA